MIITMEIHVGKRKNNIFEHGDYYDEKRKNNIFEYGDYHDGNTC